MAKFYGPIGYSESSETAPDVWTDEIKERKYSGDVIRDTRRVQSGDKVNDDQRLNNVISIIADPFAYRHFYSFKYVRWMGVCWKISSVEVQRPRLILTIGEVYNGPQAGSQ